MHHIPHTTHHTPSPFLSAFTTYLRELSADKQHSTILNIQSTIRHLQTFESLTSPLSFGPVPQQAGEGLGVRLEAREQAIKQYFIAQNLTHNTIHKHFKIIRRFLFWAVRKELIAAVPTDLFALSEIKNQVVYLTADELNRIERLELPPDTPVFFVRQAFLLACYTSLRFSDIANLTQDNARNGFIYKVIKKTNSITTIPLLPQAQSIIDSFGFGKIPDNAQFNRLIKQIGKMAGITEPAIKVRFFSGTTTQTIVPKYQLLSPHTARRTFINILHEKGMPLPEIQSITGQSFATIQRYINNKVSDKRKTESLNKYWNDL